MADLYTSQVHLKRLLAGQATAAFTPASGSVLQLLDPAFFPGMGALSEDDTGKIRCPVRGCGEWHYYLGNHAFHAHRGIGGIAAIRAAVGIPARVSLLSSKERDKRREFTSIALQKAHAAPANTRGRFVKGDGRGGRHAGPQYSSSQQSVHRHNWSDTCPAQLAARISELRQRLDRSPSMIDFRRVYGEGGIKAVLSVFGSWNNAKAIVGLELLTSGSEPRITTALVVESLRAWVEAHGDLPTTYDARNLGNGPRLPAETTIRRAFGARSWAAAMRSAIEHLGIKSERYGSPNRRSA